MEQSRHLHHGLFFLIAGVVFLFGCAGPKVVNVDYNDRIKPGPPYTPREKPATWGDQYFAAMNGAESIGRILIHASKRKDAEKVAPAEAAKFGADFYDLNFSSSPVTTKGSKIDRYTYTRGSKTDYGGRTRITETTIYEVDRYGKGWWCELYRVSPDPKKRDSLFRDGFNDCVYACKGLAGITSPCSWFTLKQYLARGADPNSGAVPPLNMLIHCILKAGSDNDVYHDDNYEKLRILFDAGADPNLSRGSALKNVRDQIPITTKRLAKLEQEPRKKWQYNKVRTYLDFLKKIEALLVEKGARIY